MRGMDVSPMRREELPFPAIYLTFLTTTTAQAL
jgi:hypothetical protein